MSEEIKLIGAPAGRISRISMYGKVWVARKYPKSETIWLQGSIDMMVYVNDRIRTNNVTFCQIDYFTGGCLGLNKNTEVEITEVNYAEEINMSFERKIQKKFGSVKKDPLQIRTSAGIMGIHGDRKL